METAIDTLIDHITDPENKWDASKYFHGKRYNGSGVVELTYAASYQLGTAYVVGTIGRAGWKFELIYIDNSGFQISIHCDDVAPEPRSFPPHNIEEVKTLLTRVASA